MYLKKFYLVERIKNNTDFSKLMASITAMLGLMPLAILPLYIGSLIDELHYSVEMAGLLTSVNLLANAFGVLLVSLITRFTFKQFVYLGGFLELIFEILSSLADYNEHLFILRFFAGLGGGIVTGAAFNWLAKQESPDRGFALLVMLQFLIASILYFCLPPVILQYGVVTFYGVLVLSVLLSVSCSFILDQGNNSKTLKYNDEYERDLISSPPNNVKTSQDKILISKVLLSIALFELAASGLWAFVERVGLSWQLNSNDIGNSLSIGALAGVPASILVIVFSLRWGRARPLAWGFILTILSLLLFIIAPKNFLFYCLALILFNGAWSYVIPYLQGIQAQMDESGHVAVAGMFVTLCSIAIGPYIFSLFIDGQNYFTPMIIVCGLITTSFALIFTIARKLDLKILLSNP